MDSPDHQPPDPAAAAGLVARLVIAIDASDDRFRAVLLSDLLCAAWGSSLAQRQ